MLNINGKLFDDLLFPDIKACIDKVDESFFFEFKEDGVSTNVLAEEISAFANTYGGYIFLGVSDDKQIMGCELWDEQRIYNVFHDCLTPLPIFSVKRFVSESNKIIYVIRIDEGAEAPYITNKGKIFERISSSSSVIKDSGKLSYLFLKRRDYEERIMRKIEIEEIKTDINNVYGYYDIGFELLFRDKDLIENTLKKVDEAKIASELFTDSDFPSFSRIGDSIIFSYLSISIKNRDSFTPLPAHANNFMEIMKDGSVRLRVLLFTDSQYERDEINIFNALNHVSLFELIYRKLLTNVLSDNFVYAKKYERLRINKQFSPVFRYPDSLLEGDEEYIKRNELIKKKEVEHIRSTGKDYFITNNRVPDIGYSLIDRHVIESDGFDYNEISICKELFNSRILNLKYIDDI